MARSAKGPRDLRVMRRSEERRRGVSPLAFNGRDATDTRSELGARFDRVLALYPNAVLALRGRVAWAHDWVTGEDLKPPADHHGCGGYHPCPGLRRCSCEAAGYCLRGQCPACVDRVCNAAWTAIAESS